VHYDIGESGVEIGDGIREGLSTGWLESHGSQKTGNSSPSLFQKNASALRTIEVAGGATSFARRKRISGDSKKLCSQKLKRGTKVGRAIGRGSAGTAGWENLLWGVIFLGRRALCTSEQGMDQCTPLELSG